MKTETNVLAVAMLLAALNSTSAQPVITSQPQDQTNLVGGTVTFSVAATGTEPLSYQWRAYSNTNPPAFTNIPGATSGSLVLSNLEFFSPFLRRWFGAVVSNAQGAVTSHIARLMVLTQELVRVQFDAPPDSLPWSWYVTGEAGGALSLTVNRDRLGVAFSVDYATVNIGAQSGADYSGRTGTVAFASSQASATIVIPILNDSAVEGTEYFQVRLSNPNPGGYLVALGERHTATVTIYDNDNWMASELPATGEEAGQATVYVHRGDDGTNTATVDFATRDGTATAGLDYVSTNGTLTFARGEMHKSFTVPILNDGLTEGDETVRITLSNPTGGPSFCCGAGVTELTADLTIDDNDPGFQFSVSHRVSETGVVVTVTVWRGDDLNAAVSVDYATSDGTATAGQDYTARNGTLQFAVGETTQTLVIPILNDSLGEETERFNVTLSNPSAGVSLGARRVAVVAIVDDDRPPNPRPGPPKTIAAGQFHTLALKTNGSLWAWGANWLGQLGIGVTSEVVPSTNIPVRVGSDNDWVAVTAGSDHSLSLKADGSLWAWGYNRDGQLGIGATWEVVPMASVPVRVVSDNDWLMMAAGSVHSLGLKSDGSLWAWGGNGYGQLGIGGPPPDWPTLTNIPTRVGLENDWAWVGAGLYQTVATKTDGTLWAWGNNEWGQLGLGEAFCCTNTPMQVGMDNDWEIVVTGGGSFLWGNGETIALKNDGTLWSWGANMFGQLGDGTTTGRSSPARAGGDEDWAALAAGGGHTLALKFDGSLWAWGANDSGQSGIGVDFVQHVCCAGQIEPARVGLDNDWVTVAAGLSHTIGLKCDGSLWAWGADSSGQLGLGGEFFQSTNVPTRIGTDNDWAVPTPPIGELRITAMNVVGGRAQISFTHTSTRAYYILYRGTDPASILQHVQARLAHFSPLAMTDPTPVSSNASVFYRIRAVLNEQPLDLDGDGIDDDYELRHASFLDPFNAADAAQDTDGDGYSNLAEYRAGTDPSFPTVRHSIASGLAHTVVLKQDGSIWAWGDNGHGQLGDDTYESRAEPVRIGTDTDWISVSAGRDSQYGDHTVAVKRDGSLWAWGANSWGQLGYPPDQIPGTNVPVRIGNSTAWTDVSAGGGFTAALQRNGSLWVWGNNTWNVVPCCNDPWVPKRVGNGNRVALSAGGTHILALSADRSLWAWGDNSGGQCGLGQGVSPGNIPTRVGTDNDWIAIAASGEGGGQDYFAHSLGLKSDGTLWSWGLDNFGELGLGNSGFVQYTPYRVGMDTDWAVVAASGGTSLARKRDGSLWAWGAGIGAVPRLASPSLNWKELAAGGALSIESFPSFATAVTADGSLWTWRLGPHMSRVPIRVGAESNWAAVAAGSAHSLALKLDGSLWGWGGNYYGQLGDGTFGSRPTPRCIASNTTWKSVSAGWDYTVALRDDERLWAWGRNDVGQLGIGTFSTGQPSGINTPQAVATNTTWLSVAAGGAHTVALRADGSLWTWGGGAYGQLGNGVFVTNFPFGIAFPVSVEPAATWSAAASGAQHTIGLRSDGSLWACGNNTEGQLGLGFFTTNAPHGISSLQPISTNVLWKSITAGGGHTVAISTDEELWAWGANNYGQLGNGSFVATNSPQSIDKTWKAVATGFYHAVALDTNGVLWTWGANLYGQLGIGTSANSSNTPQVVLPNTTWKAIAAGNVHTLAIREDGTLWSWGWNYYGQLGVLSDLSPTRLGTATDWGSPP